MLNRLNRQYEKNAYVCYIADRGDCIEEELSEEEHDTVEPLNDDPTGKYTNLMAHTRERKWGMIQRTEYEAKRTTSLSNSRQTGISSRVTRGVSEGKDTTTNLSDKVTVN